MDGADSSFPIREILNQETGKWEKGFLRMLKFALVRYDSVGAATFTFYLGNPFPRFLLPHFKSAKICESS
jgi:hypothetical protein